MYRADFDSSFSNIFFKQGATKLYTFPLQVTAGYKLETFSKPVNMNQFIHIEHMKRFFES